MGILKRSSSAVCVALVAMIAAGTARAQDYPTRPVRIISGFGPGSAGDMLARIVSQKLSPALGQHVARGAGPEPADDAHRPRRVVLRPRRPGRNHGHQRNADGR